jgi:hypothetical protein
MVVENHSMKSAHPSFRFMAVAAGLLGSFPARADGPEPAATVLAVPSSPSDRFRTPAFTLELGGGTNTPAGHWSIGLGAELGRRLSVAVAVVEDISGRHRRASLGPRLRFFVHGPLALDGSLVLSNSNGDELGAAGLDAQGNTWSYERRWESFYRLQPELGVVYRVTSRFALRLFGGVGLSLTPSSCSYAVRTPSGPTTGNCQSPDAPPEVRRSDRAFPYAGLSLSVGMKPLAAPPEDWRGLPRTAGWYGWQILATDAAALGAGLLARNDDGRVLAVAGDLTAAALVHGLHERPGRAVLSVLTRVALVLVGESVAVALTPRDALESEADDAPVRGAAAGALVASLVDALLLAHER